MMAIMFIQALLPLNNRHRLAETFFKYIPPISLPTEDNMSFISPGDGAYIPTPNEPPLLLLLPSSVWLS